MSDPIIGIDLGTTNSVVAAADEGGKVQILADEKGFKIQPSVVSFHPNGSVVVGAAAKQRRVIDPKNTVYSAKRLIGRTYGSSEVRQGMQRVPYTIKEGINEQPVIVTRAGEFAIPEISAIVLDHMRSIAKRGLGADVGRAVVTVPANFTEAQRSATATAGAIAGLTVVRVLNEPTAAALAYGQMRRTNEIIAVYDFGGGTFDCTILELRDDIYQVLATAGDTFLGGDDIDERLVDVMVASFLKSDRIDLRADELAMQRLRMVAEQTKIELSRRARAVIRVDEIAYGPGGTPLNLSLELTRDDLVSRCTDLVDRSFAVCAEALQLSSLPPGKIAEVVLVGGTTKMPYVRERVGAFFARTPRTDVNPDEAVAVGAALQAAAMARVLNPETRAQAQPRATTQLHAAATQLPGGAPPVGGPKPPTMPMAPAYHRPTPPPTPAFERNTASGPAPAPPGPTTVPGGPPPLPPTPEGPPPLPGKRPASPIRETSPRVATPDADKPDKVIRDTSPRIASAADRAAHPPAEVSLTGDPAMDAAALDAEPTGVRHSTRQRAASMPPPIPRTPPGRSTQPQFAGSAPGADGEQRPSVTMPMPTVRPFDQPTLMPRDEPSGLSLLIETDVDADVATMPELLPNQATTRHSRSVVTAPPEREPPALAAGLTAGAASARTLIGESPPPTSATGGAAARTLIGATPPTLTRSTAAYGTPPADAATLPPTSAPPFPMTGPDRPRPPTAPPFSMSPPSVPAAGAWLPPAIGLPPDPLGPAKKAPPPGPPMVDLELPPEVPITPLAPPSAPTLAAVVARPAAAPALVSTRPGPPPVAPQVIEVLPHGLGIGTVGTFCEEILQRNRSVPAEQMKVFATASDQQTAVRIRVYRGSSRRVPDNTLLGELVLDGLEARPRGEIRIAVTFQVDAGGMLTVRARDQKSGAEQRATLNILGAQSPDEIAAAQGRLRDLRGPF